MPWITSKVELSWFNIRCYRAKGKCWGYSCTYFLGITLMDMYLEVVRSQVSLHDIPSLSQQLSGLVFLMILFFAVWLPRPYWWVIWFILGISFINSAGNRMMPTFKQELKLAVKECGGRRWMTGMHLPICFSILIYTIVEIWFLSAMMNGVDISYFNYL